MLRAQRVAVENFQRATLFKHGKASSFHRTHGLEPGGEEMKTQASLTRPESKEQRERESGRVLGDRASSSVEPLVFLRLALGMNHRNEGHSRGALEIEEPR